MKYTVKDFKSFNSWETEFSVHPLSYIFLQTYLNDNKKNT